MDSINEVQDKINAILSEENTSIGEEAKEELEAAYYQLRLEELAHKKKLRDFEKPLNRLFEEANRLINVKVKPRQAQSKMVSDPVEEVGEEEVYEAEE